jgi:hypothetical protein
MHVAAKHEKEIVTETMIAYCGIICSKCPVYLATQADDDQARAEVAKLWSKQYGMDIKPEDVNCDGCLQKTGRLFSHCRVCDIRACGMEKKISTCAVCADYACEKLKAFHSIAPHAGRMLEKLRAKS